MFFFRAFGTGKGGKDGWTIGVNAAVGGKGGPLRSGAIVSPLRRPLEKLRKDGENAILGW